MDDTERFIKTAKDKLSKLVKAYYDTFAASRAVDSALIDDFARPLATLKMEIGYNYLCTLPETYK